jgi:flagellar export protein FliJ
MAFRYSLESVLRLRRSLEHQEEQRLFALAAVVARLRTMLERMQQSDVAQRRAALAEMEEFSSGAQLQFRAACDDASLRLINRVKGQLQDAERQRLEQLKVYQEARQRREIFEGLRERQQELYKLNQSRRQQQRTDEAFLIRAFLNPHG